MRIGVDLTAIWRPATGMENVAIEMTRALLRADKVNRYILFFAGVVHPAFEEFSGRYEAVLGPVAHEALLKNLWFPKAASAARLDYLHFPIFPPPLWCPWTTGWTVPDATPWMYPDTMKASSRWYFRLLGGRAVRKSRILITDTESARQDLLTYLRIPPDRLHVIYPGVKPVFRVHRDAHVFDEVRRRHALPANFILFVGTIEPRKNLRRLLRAFRMLKTERNFAPSLVIVGRKGWLYDSVFSELADEEFRASVTITGYVSDEDLVQIYNMADSFVFPSLYEGFGLPCVEAMMCGCPVITANRGALREVTGDCALHTDPEDVRAIADAIWKVSRDSTLRNRLVSNGPGRAALYSWSTYAERLLDLMGRLS